jgi:hypothetical protein
MIEPMHRLRIIYLTVAVALCSTAAGLASPAGASSWRHCRGFSIKGGHVKSMKVKLTTCRHGQRVVKDLYAGRGSKTYPVHVDGWTCYSGTGLTSCTDHGRSILAKYRLNG